MNKINETNEPTTYFIDHHLNIKFPGIPFLWNYNDFGQPFFVKCCKKISIYKLKNLISKTKNINLHLNMVGLSDKNTDVYILCQYRDNNNIYSPESNPNELYLSYHTLLYTNRYKSKQIPTEELNCKFGFLTGLYKIEGNIEQYEFYPYKNQNNNKLGGGIPIDAAKLDNRYAKIHKVDNYNTFSGINTCNFYVRDDNCVFVSIIKRPFIINNNKKEKVFINNKKENCVVLHIFRNIGDCNAKNKEYEELISKYWD